MVLESLINPKNAEDKPWHIFFVALVYSFVAIIFATQLFPSEASILAVAIITIIFVPFFQKLFEIEEDKENKSVSNATKQNIFSRHGASIYVFSAFFLGIVVAMSFAFIFLPFGNVFSLQSQWFSDQGTFVTGQATAQNDFALFFLNNSQVMILMFILSIVMGAGSVFILTWNASIVAVFIGFYTKTLIGPGVGSAQAYLIGLPAGLGSIAIHGIPEIAAYFFAGLAGGILSIGIIREKYGTKEFKRVFKDSLIFLGFAEVLILFAAVLEAVI